MAGFQEEEKYPITKLVCPVDNELDIQTLKYLHAFPS
jgi:hypothetical protein